MSIIGLTLGKRGHVTRDSSRDHMYNHIRRVDEDAGVGGSGWVGSDRTRRP